MSDLFQPDEFDTWASSYDLDVQGEKGFPFEGYAAVLQGIADRAEARPADSVLDLGAGTGNLTLLFARAGCEVWGLDFSSKMLALAHTKLPQAVFGQADLREEWPPAFRRRFDRIVSGYTFHHFPLGEKVALVKRLINENLLPDGRLLIGDISFRDAAAEDLVRQAMGSDWEQEYFWLADEALAAFSLAGIAARFVAISPCAGIFQFGPE